MGGCRQSCVQIRTHGVLFRDFSGNCEVVFKRNSKCNSLVIDHRKRGKITITIIIAITITITITITMTMTMTMTTIIIIIIIIIITIPQ